MANNKCRYKELAKARIQDKRNLVISAFEFNGEDNGFTIAQQLEVEEGNKKTSIFLKDSIHIDDLNGMYALRDALNLAIKSFNENDNSWDEE